MKKPLIILTGPTAVGKTAASIGLAKAIGGEIISADSMQVYRHMDIGSAKIQAKRDARDLAPSDRCAGAGGRVPCGEIPADGKGSTGWDLSERTYPHCCRRNWVLYPGSVV